MTVCLCACVCKYVRPTLCFGACGNVCACKSPCVPTSPRVCTSPCVPVSTRVYVPVCAYFSTRVEGGSWDPAAARQRSGRRSAEADRGQAFPLQSGLLGEGPWRAEASAGFRGVCCHLAGGRRLAVLQKDAVSAQAQGGHVPTRGFVPAPGQGRCMGRGGGQDPGA